ncbi:NAD(P)-binding domain-containing protein [uncultured Fibrella sp.]|uniref:NAD(P)-binding domain-containing protein n=1 Tax=uncultured Fibrella sp. TaxID=1284596 RepID=UPI0035CBB75D
MNHETTTLIIGAGPFGLGLASYLQQRRHEYQLVGKPMEFWEQHMPKGMLLRSNTNWHLDTDNQWTIDRFFTEHYPARPLSDPISREHYIEYLTWFIEQTGIPVTSTYVRHLSKTGDSFTAELDNGDTIQAQHVVLATGFQYFTCFPANLLALLPAGRFQHTCHAVQMDVYRDRRVLIVGGRQSAFESAALLREAGARAVHVSYRHDTPRFEEADWSWVETIVAQMANQPAWFRELSAEEQEQYRYKLWAEGRLKVEPWLEARVCQPNVTLHPHTELIAASLDTDNSLRVSLSSGEQLLVDDVMLATGYQVDVKRLPFLSASLQESLAVNNGFPLLETDFQSNVPGLYFSSFPAGQSFGPFFGFTVAVRTAALLIGKSLCERMPIPLGQ